EYSFAACLGMDVSDLGKRGTPMDLVPAQAAARRALQQFPQLKAVAFTLRDASNASRNGWAGALCTRDKTHLSTQYAVDILDRVGGGDAFVSGLLHGVLSGLDLQQAVELGA